MEGGGMGIRVLPPGDSTPQNPDQGVQALKDQSQVLAQQLADIQRRIKKLEDEAR
jgi:hypothetical protein